MATQVHGLGEAYKRKEDARFIRGQGHYVDDVQLRGMLYGDIVRSPYGHALIKSIDTSQALKVPGVLAVITGKDLDAAGLAWMPTLSADTEAVLALERVHYQMQEVAFVVATSRYAAADGVAAVEVEYEPLPVVVDPKKAIEPDAPLLRPDKKDKQPTNQIYHWETGDHAATDAAFAEAQASGIVVEQEMYIPRIHPAPIETCGCVADFNKATGKLTVWMTSQAPHAHRTLFAIVSKLPEHRIRIISPDIGGGFGNKVPIYPGYVCAVVASIVTGKPVKWIEDRTENLSSTGFGRDYHIKAEIAADKDGTVKALKVYTLADHGAFDAAAQPTKFPAGLFHICTGSYDFKNAFVEVDAAHTNKAPGGIAYRCSFRVTEASYLIERAMDTLAREVGKDPAQIRMQNFIRPEAFPYRSALNWTYDSGNYEAALHLAMKNVDYEGLRREQAEKRARGELMGIGISSFTEIVGAGPGKHFDIACILPAKRWPASACRRRARGTKRPSRRSSPPNLVCRRTISMSSMATRIQLRMDLVPMPAAARPSPVPRLPWRLVKCAKRRRRLPPTCWRSAKMTSSGSRGVSSSRDRPTRARRFRNSRLLPTPIVRPILSRDWRP